MAVELPEGKKNLIITIGRQYGSGGREIGERLAKKLGIGFYDKALIALAAEKSGLDPELFKRQNEEVKSGLGYLLAHISRIGAEDMPMSDRLFVATSKTIREIAAHESCVIVGRCGDYILEDKHDEYLILDFFIHISDDKQRVARVMRRNNISREEAEERIAKVSKGRMSFYERYTGRKWGQMENYHLTLDSAPLTIDGTVDVLEDYVRRCLAYKGYPYLDDPFAPEVDPAAH